VAGMFFRDDVFDMERVEDLIVLMELAVLAPMAGSLPD
jgi:hypothetical protein